MAGMVCRVAESHQRADFVQAMGAGQISRKCNGSDWRRQCQRVQRGEQEAGQGLAEFYSHIQEAADTCDFLATTQEVREMMVLQVFVKGMRSEGIRATLLQKERLKLEEALELAQVVEMAEVEAHGMAGGSGFGQLGVRV